MTFDLTSKTFTGQILYPLWVGGTQVTSANASNIDGNNKASYNADTKTLTLDNYSYSGEGYAVTDEEEDFTSNYAVLYDDTTEPLNIVLSGENSLNCTGTDDNVYFGIRSRGDLTISGTGSASVSGKDTGIIAEADERNYNGIYVFGNDGLVINGGSLTTTGARAGIRTTRNGPVVIGNNCVVVAAGDTQAIDGTLKNAVAGTGWTDAAGTEGKENIAVSNEGQKLTCKKAQFPGLPEASVTTAPTPKTLTYTESAQELVKAGTASDGTMKYALGTDDKTAPTDGWDTSIPTGSKVGTYYVWYKAAGDVNHNDSTPNFVEVKIDPVNKETLNKAIQEADDYYKTIKDKYSTVAAALKSAIDKAKQVAADDNTDITKISQAITSVKVAKAEAAQKVAEADKKAAENSASQAQSNTLAPLAKISKVKVKGGKGKATVSWKAVTGAKGYEIFVSGNKKGTKKIRIAKAKGTKKVIKKLGKGKYYIKVRAWKSYKDNTVYGKYSKAKQVKVK